MHRAANTAVLAAVLMSMLAAGAAQAQGKSGKSDSARDTANQLRPSGPVTVKADRVEWVQDNTMKYAGNVSMTSNTLTVIGDTMDVKQSPDGNFEALIRGNPGKLDHAPDPNATGNAAQPVHAEAREIHYDSRTGTVDMSGNAHLKRGDDIVDGNTIGYVVPERRIRAAGGGDGGGQVTITFQPPPPKSGATPSDKKP